MTDPASKLAKAIDDSVYEQVTDPRLDETMYEGPPVVLAKPSKPYHTCTMGVGCEQIHRCFAERHGRPEYCEAGDGGARRIIRDMRAMLDRVWEDSIELKQTGPLYFVPDDYTATEARIVGGIPGDSIRVVRAPYGTPTRRKP